MTSRPSPPLQYFAALDRALFLTTSVCSGGCLHCAPLRSSATLVVMRPASLLLAVAAAGCVSEPNLGDVSPEVLLRCPAPSAYFKANPQPDECRISTLTGVNGFNFYFSAVDVVAQDLHVYFFNETNSEFLLVDPPSLPNVVSFHTEWDAAQITRAYWASVGGATAEVGVPANLVGVY